MPGRRSYRRCVDLGTKLVHNIMNPRHIQQFIRSTLGRLALSYLAIIMVMSVGFSVVFYNTTAHELGRQLPPSTFFQNNGFDNDNRVEPQVNKFFEDRISEGREALLLRLVLLNMLTLAVGSMLSYYLAKRTLQPIEENVEAQAQFVSDASHELRTPLTVLQMTNEVALRREKMTVKDAKDVLRQNIVEVAKLQTLTDSLLRLARQNKYDMALTSLLLQHVATDAINKVVQQALEKDIVVKDAVPHVTVLGDAQSLSQAVAILLDNAIKYSPKGSTIYVEGRAQGKFGYLTVRDEGQGIEAVDLPHIFDRFYRADQSRNKHKIDGYGIGLSLAQKIIEQHKGTITVESVPHKGATFIIKLPLA